MAVGGCTDGFAREGTEMYPVVEGMAAMAGIDVCELAKLVHKLTLGQDVAGIKVKIAGRYCLLSRSNGLPQTCRRGQYKHTPDRD
jgi:hypothetical protein